MDYCNIFQRQVLELKTTHSKIKVGDSVNEVWTPQHLLEPNEPGLAEGLIPPDFCPISPQAT